MRIDDLISKLQSVRDIEGCDVECCTYDSVIEDYTNSLCLEIVDDDYYVDENNMMNTDVKILLL